jgi:circadian clock protein KaiB
VCAHDLNTHVFCPGAASCARVNWAAVHVRSRREEIHIPSLRVYQFVLYVAGDTHRSQRAIANLRRLGEERLAGKFALSIVDVRNDPASAERERILTTPTLIKQSPLPVRRVTGDLSDFEQVLIALSLSIEGEA